MIQPSEHRPTQIIIRKEAIQHNINYMKKQLQAGQKLYAVVKANAYGHGAVGISRLAAAAGVDGLAASSIDEGIELRKAGIQLPILVLSLSEPAGIAEVLYYDLQVVIGSATYLERAYEQLQASHQLDLLETYSLRYHLALDTGMGRIGLQTVEELQSFIEASSKYPWALWTGVSTHFATAAGGDPEYIEVQWKKWNNFLEYVPSSVSERHFANSAMGLWDPVEPHTTIVRFGIGLYGLDPRDYLMEEEVSRFDLDNHLPVNTTDDLRPALSLVSELAYVKKVPAGSHISYGAHYVAEEEEWIGTVPIGYGDGWLRAYQPFNVLVEGIPCEVIHPINMDQLMIRLPREFKRGTQVTLLGQSGESYNHPSVLAQEIGTISYEIVTNLSKRIARIYI